MTNMKNLLAEKTNNAAKRATFVGNIYEEGVAKVKQTILDTIHPDLMEYHSKGYIHIHDLEGYGRTYNCLTLNILKNFPYAEVLEKSDFHKILHIIEYYKLAIANLANEQTGGISFANFDMEISQLFTSLNIQENEVNFTLLTEVIDSFIYWINHSLTRYGQECYYVSLNFGLSTTAVGRHVVKSILHIYENANYNVSVIRPNIIFKVQEDINLTPNTQNYDLLLDALQCTSKKMNPTYLLCSSPTNKAFAPELLSIVGCRTRVVQNRFGEPTSIGRGNIANISINLPRLAFETIAEQAEDIFQTFKEKWLTIAQITKTILLDRYQRTCELDIDNYPTNSYYQFWEVPFEENSNLESVFKHGTLSIGFIGLSEAMEILFDKSFYEDDESYEFSKQFVRFMREQLNQFGDEENLNFSLLATSGEGISSRFVDIDSKYYVSPLFEKGYYTNSFHIDVDSMIHPFKKIQLEGAFHKFCNGGSITYVELGSAPLNNTEALYDMVTCAIQSDVCYLGFNYPLDICKDCGYSGTFDICSHCDSDNIKRIRRVSGYLEDLSNFGKGKRNEEKNRRINSFSNDQKED